MENIKVGFSKSKSKFAPFSWAIMLTEHTAYSHVYVKFWDSILNRWVIYQASHMAVNMMGEELFDVQESVIREFDFSTSLETKNKMMNFCLDTIGLPYGTISALGLGMVQIASLVNIQMHNPFKDVGKTYVCSQAVAALLEAAGVDIAMDLNDITPRDLFPIIESLPKVIG
jgi:hypothetical protein